MLVLTLYFVTSSFSSNERAVLVFCVVRGAGDALFVFRVVRGDSFCGAGDTGGDLRDTGDNLRDAGGDLRDTGGDLRDAGGNSLVCNNKNC